MVVPGVAVPGVVGDTHGVPATPPVVPVEVGGTPVVLVVPGVLAVVPVAPGMVAVVPGLAVGEVGVVP